MKSFIEIELTVEELEKHLKDAKAKNNKYVKISIPTQLPVHTEKQPEYKEHPIRFTPKEIQDEYGKGGTTFKLISNTAIPPGTAIYKEYKDAGGVKGEMMYVQSVRSIGSDYFEYRITIPYSRHSTMSIKLEDFKQEFIYYK